MIEVLRYFGLPTNYSTQGVEIDAMLSWVHWLMLILFVGWGGFFIWTLFKFRASKNPSGDYKGVKSHFSRYVEVAVAVLEVILLVGFAFPAWNSRVEGIPPENKAVVVRVVAEQFAWNIHYPGADGVFGRTDYKLINKVDNPLGLDRSDPMAKDDITTINQMYLPVNRPVIVHLSSKDVIHSFNLPGFRVKQDVVPGMTIPTWFEPIKTTLELTRELSQTYDLDSSTDTLATDLIVSISNKIISEAIQYEIGGTTVTLPPGKEISIMDLVQLKSVGVEQISVQPKTEIACAQLCGLGHYRMRGFVTIQTRDEFDAWLDSQAEELIEYEEDDWW